MKRITALCLIALFTLSISSAYAHCRRNWWQSRSEQWRWDQGEYYKDF